MKTALLLTQLFATLSMVGVIWFVQIVHYPLFAAIGKNEFPQYETAHQQKTTLVVAPLMLLEAGTALLLLVYRPSYVSPWQVWLGAVLVGVLWASTFLWQVPLHGRLATALDNSIQQQLVFSNWLRTFVWTARGILVCAMVGRSLPWD